MREGTSLRGARAADCAAEKTASRRELCRNILSAFPPQPTWWSPNVSAGVRQTGHSSLPLSHRVSVLPYGQCGVAGNPNSLASRYSAVACLFHASERGMLSIDHRIKLRRHFILQYILRHIAQARAARYYTPGNQYFSHCGLRQLYSSVAHREK